VLAKVALAHPVLLSCTEAPAAFLVAMLLCSAAAGLNCLLQFYAVPDCVLPVDQRPSLVLSAEAELGITAGLQDRVIQVTHGTPELLLCNCYHCCHVRQARAMNTLCTRPHPGALGMQFRTDSEGRTARCITT
jgi:hypothetical protein